MVVLSISVPVVYLHHVLCRETQSTMSTTSLLLFQQPCYPQWSGWFSAKAFPPVQPVAIVGAFVSPDFDVSGDGHIGVVDQRTCPVAEARAGALALPVTCTDTSHDSCWRAADTTIVPTYSRLKLTLATLVR
jgi:hypothetical protein